MYCLNSSYDVRIADYCYLVLKYGVVPYIVKYCDNIFKGIIYTSVPVAQSSLEL